LPALSGLGQHRSGQDSHEVTQAATGLVMRARPGLVPFTGGPPRMIAKKCERLAVEKSCTVALHRGLGRTSVLPIPVVGKVDLCSDCSAASTFGPDAAPALSIAQARIEIVSVGAAEMYRLEADPVICL